MTVLDANPISPPSFDSAARDRYFWQTIKEALASHEMDLQTVLRHFPAFVMRRDIPRFLSHYELFKQVIDLPGCVVDLGVWYGSSFFTWAKLLETFCPFDRSRKVFGFDSFEGLTQFSEKDGAKSDTVQKCEGGYLAPEEFVQTLVKLHNSDNMIPNTERCKLIVGDLTKTLPEFLKAHPGLKISLLHFDVDLYEPTKYALELLYPYVVKGGVVCLDEYGLIPWQGETNAVDEFFAKHPNPPTIKKHPFAQTPHGYFIK